jgi:hypothetical protein
MTMLMKSVTTCFLIALVSAWAGPLPAADAPTNAAPASVFAPIDFLPGGVWRGDLPSGTNEIKTQIEAKYEWTGNHQAIRFETAWVTGDKRRPYCSGMYVWNAEKKQIEVIYTDSKGGLVEGTLAVEGEIRQTDLKLVDNSGKVQTLHSKMTHPDPTTFINEMSMKRGDDWQKLITVRYERPQ